MTQTRRQFLGRAGALAGAASLAPLASQLNAWTLTAPLGVQCYDLKDLLAKDYAGTWKAVAGLGYKLIDMISYKGYGFDPKLDNIPAKDIRKSLADAGLSCEVCHFPAPYYVNDYAKTIAFAHDLGVKRVIAMPDMVISMVGTPDIAKTKTIEDWKAVGKQLNEIGKKTLADGLPLGYHNHEFEFRPIGGAIPYDAVAAATDPKLVSFQIDVGNLALGGGDPVTYIKKYSKRLFAAHLKDLSKNGQLGVAVGEGKLDFKSILAALHATKVNNYTVETGAPPDQVIAKFKASIDYLRKLEVR
jgi:sugar phosphate isomerase/epimerase